MPGLLWRALGLIAHFSAANAEPPPQQPQRQPMPKSPSFRVQRDGPWLRQTAERVGGVLVQALPPLQGHPHASVRAAVTHGELDCVSV